MNTYKFTFYGGLTGCKLTEQIEAESFDKAMNEFISMYGKGSAKRIIKVKELPNMYQLGLINGAMLGSTLTILLGMLLAVLFIF